MNLIRRGQTSIYGQVSVSLMGNTRTNLVKSSNMDTDSNADGVVTDFFYVTINTLTATYSLDTVEKAQKIDITASTNTDYAQVYQEVPINAGEILSLKVSGKISGNVKVRIALEWFNSSGTSISANYSNFTTPTIFTELKLENLTAPTGTAKARIRFQAFPNAIGDVGMAWFKKALLEKSATAGSYIPTGTKSTISNRLFSRTQNAFNKAKVTKGYSVNTDGTLIASVGNNASDYIRVKPSVTYIRGNTTTVAFYDEFKNFISTVATQSFTVPSNARFLRFTITDANLDTMMLVEGTVYPTSYITYGESFAYYILPQGEVLRSVGVVKDEVNATTGELIKRISNEVILDGNLPWGTLITSTNTYLVRLDAWVTGKNVLTQTSNSGNAYSTDGNYVIGLDYGLDIKQIVFHSNTNLYLRVERAKVDVQTGVDTLAKIKAYLNQYPITLTYQLMNQVVTQLTPKPVTIFANGTRWVEHGHQETAIYNNGVAVVDTRMPILTMVKVDKLEIAEGTFKRTEIPLSSVTVASNGLSFTITGATNGETYEFSYDYDSSLGTLGELVIPSEPTLKTKLNRSIAL